ncbi:hypothetical protein P171DRAFT_486768 [Karstenula rhodostoma CBS 690.94]|uniref:Uncharacterized protein n=1 Tax=Karstenula rhodostoma CBS 690.94 TaxID=1392251 RepID=A0A9P4PGL6_9PLEO|nr:hypothetical protein P171DRAFT_486768 [Karstenula rhodostoma CBS 690.94]
MLKNRHRTRLTSAGQSGSHPNGLKQYPSQPKRPQLRPISGQPNHLQISHSNSIPHGVILNHINSIAHLAQHTKSRRPQCGLSHPGPLSRPDQPHPQPKKPRCLPRFARGESGGQSPSGCINQGTIGTSSSESESSGDPVGVGFGGLKVFESQSPVQMGSQGTISPEDDSDKVLVLFRSIVGTVITDSTGRLPVTNEGVITAVEGEDAETSDGSKIVEELSVSTVGIMDTKVVVLLKMLTGDVLIVVEVEVTETPDDIFNVVV